MLGNNVGGIGGSRGSNVRRRRLRAGARERERLRDDGSFSGGSWRSAAPLEAFSSDMMSFSAAADCDAEDD